MKRVKKKNINTTAYWNQRYFEMAVKNQRQGPNRQLADSILGHTKGTVLDVGCGRGLMAQLMMDAGHKVTGIDQSPTVIKHCNISIAPGMFYVVDITKGLPFPDDSFTTVTCLDVLEHMDDPERLVKELIRVAGNIVIVAVPNGHSIMTDEHVWEIFPKDLKEWFPGCHIEKDHFAGKRLLAVYTLPGESGCKTENI